MITAIDSNVLVALWGGTTEVALAIAALLGTVGEQGPLVIAPAVYAELVAAPDRETVFVDTFLAAARIQVDWVLDEAVWRSAAHAFRSYAARRDDAGPRRLLADFIIGAHAVHAEAVLLTLDARLYRAAFPTLRLRTPDS